MDIGIGEGDEITFYYDPMIGKIIAKGDDRKQSIQNMVQFLKEIEIEGINTNKSFLLAILQSEFFVEANYNTKFIENNLSLFSKKIDSIGSLEINKEATKKIKA